MPLVSLYFVRLYNKEESFIKIGVTFFISAEYSRLKDYGYKLQELEVLKFPKQSTAKANLEKYKNVYQLFKYSPESSLNKENCYTGEVMKSIEIDNVKDIHETSERIDITHEIALKSNEDLEAEIISLLKEKVPGFKIAEMLNTSTAKVSRTKKRHENNTKNKDKT